MMASYLFYPFNTILTPMLVCLVGFISHQFQSVMRHWIIISFGFVALCTDFVYIFANFCHRYKMNLLFLFKCNLYFPRIFDPLVVDEGFFSSWDFSDDLLPQFKEVYFHTFEISMAQDNTPLINPIDIILYKKFYIIMSLYSWIPNHPQ